MPDRPLSIGIPTAGRPEAIRRCLDRIDAVVEVPYELIVLDNTPDLNADVSYRDVQTVLYPDERIGPGESRQRIAEAADGEYLLFLDDDTLPRPGAVEQLVEAVGSGYTMASGRWIRNGSPEPGRPIGRDFHWARRNGQQTLVDVPISPQPLRNRGFDQWEVDVGLPTILVDTKLFESVAFDSRYEWYFEWIDFFLQTHEREEVVCACLGATFDHAEIPYVVPTMRSTQERDRDCERFLNKWEIELCREASFDETSWKSKLSLDRRAAQIYLENGLTELVSRARRKAQNRLRFRS